MSPAVLLLVGATCASGIQIKPGVTPGSLNLEARSAPWSAVLECLSRETGFKILNPAGVMPTGQLTLTVQGKNEVLLISEVLSEAGLNYGLTMNRQGTRVETLVLVGLKTKSANSPSARTTVSAPVVPESDYEVSNAEPPDPAEALRNRARTNDPTAIGSGAWPLNPQASPQATPQATPTEPYPEPKSLSPVSIREARRAGPRALNSR